MIRLTKVSADKVHKLFQLLKKLGLYHLSSSYSDVDDVFDAWKFAERNEPVTKEVVDDDTNT